MKAVIHESYHADPALCVLGALASFCYSCTYYMHNRNAVSHAEWCALTHPGVARGIAAHRSDRCTRVEVPAELRASQTPSGYDLMHGGSRGKHAEEAVT